MGQPFSKLWWLSISRFNRSLSVDASEIISINQMDCRLSSSFILSLSRSLILYIIFFSTSACSCLFLFHRSISLSFIIGRSQSHACPILLLVHGFPFKLPFESIENAPTTHKRRSHFEICAFSSFSYFPSFSSLSDTFVAFHCVAHVHRRMIDIVCPFQRCPYSQCMIGHVRIDLEMERNNGLNLILWFHRFHWSSATDLLGALGHAYWTSQARTKHVRSSAESHS